MTDSKESLEDFLKRRNLRALREFERFNTYRWEDLKLGTQLIMLRAGFGGWGGDHRVVDEIHDTHCIVVHPISKEGRAIVRKNISASPKHGDDEEYFTEYCYILTDEDLEVQKKSNRREWVKYIYEKTGYNFK